MILIIFFSLLFVYTFLYRCFCFKTWNPNPNQNQNQNNYNISQHDVKRVEMAIANVFEYNDKYKDEQIKTNCGGLINNIEDLVKKIPELQSPYDLHDLLHQDTIYPDVLLFIICEYAAWGSVNGVNGSVNNWAQTLALRAITMPFNTKTLAFTQIALVERCLSLKKAKTDPITKKPCVNYYCWINNIGCYHFYLSNFNFALVCCSKPFFDGAWINRSLTLCYLGRFSEALIASNSVISSEYWESNASYCQARGISLIGCESTKIGLQLLEKSLLFQTDQVQMNNCIRVIERAQIPEIQGSGWLFQVLNSCDNHTNFSV